MIGQEHIIQTLRNAITADRVAHAYLFAGPRGTGKTTTARLLAKAVNCLDPDRAARPCDECEYCRAVNQGRFLDLIEIDAASNTSVEDVRDLRDKINFAPNQGQYKIYLIDEVHMLSTAAFNALLKTLEEPPPHAIFILATTEIHKIPATVASRCQRYEFRRVPVNEIVTNLKHIIEGENLEADEEALVLVARQATGSLRDAQSLLDQLAASGHRITLAFAQDVLGTATNQVVIEIVEALIQRDTSSGLEKLEHALDAGADPRQFARQIVDYLRQLMLVQMGNADQVDAPQELRKRMAEQARSFSTPELLRVIRAFNTAAVEGRINWQPGLPLELAFAESVEAPAKEPFPVESPPRTEIAPSQAKPTSPSKPAPIAEEFSSSAKEGSISEAASGGDGLTLKTIKIKWPAIREAVRKINKPAEGLLNSCTVLDLRGNRLFLGFASDILKSKMEAPDSLNAALRGVEQVLGVALQIQCVIASDSHSIPPEVDESGMVAAAVRLGGKIVDSREIPTRDNASKTQ
ncbi:MAG: DNA polymerase III subunit gamma/tau [Anaerolineales bacterium]